MKYLIFLFALIMVTAFASATIEADYIYKYNTTVDIKNPCINNGTWCSASSQCNITVQYPNGSVLVNKGVMSNQNTYYNYTISDSQTLGYYPITMSCLDSGLYGVDSFYILVSKNGEYPKGDNFELLVYILFILSMAGLFFTFILNIVKITTATETIYGVLVSWGFYLLVILVSYLSNNFLLDNFISSISDNLLTITAFSNGLLPLIGLFVSIFVKSINKKGVIGIEEMTGRIVKYG